MKIDENKDIREPKHSKLSNNSYSAYQKDYQHNVLNNQVHFQESPKNLKF